MTSTETLQATDTTNPIFHRLNDQQRLAVDTLQGPVLILAGAGSGKTRALTHRIAHLMANGVPAWQILAVTFTNKAAGEMKERIKHLLKLTSANGQEPDVLPAMGTFHSICVRMLRRDIEHIGRERNFVIYDSDDQDKLMSETLKDLKIMPEDLKSRAALSAISAFKSESLSVKAVQAQASGYQTQRLAQVYAQYQSKLKEANALDFDDLLLETVRLLTERPDILDRYQETWRFIHVDEYQDTNHVQYQLITLLAQKYRNICVIGDPDQSIYAFRGADIRNILQFQHEYKDATLIKLEQNYRSTQPILDAADSVIVHNPNRPEKKMWTSQKDGAKIVLQEVLDERKEAEEALKTVKQRAADGTPANEQVILYRTNAQSRVLEEAALRSGVPYRILGGLKFYARREVKDVLAYLLAIYNPQDTLSLLRVINVPSRKIGQTTIARLQAYCNERGMSLNQALGHIEMVDGINEPTKVRMVAFRTLMEKYRELSNTMVVSELVAKLIEEIKLEEWIKDDTDEAQSRWENVKELQSVTHKYDALEPLASLSNFLEEVALISEVDKLNDARSDALTLMTLHLCKGLEFKSVIVVGCEEGIFPHSAAQMDNRQLEEERRLMYVGMTRAKEQLSLMYAQSRMLWGKTQNNVRSRFLDDIPATLIETKTHDTGSKYGWLDARTQRDKSMWYKNAPKKSEWNQDAGSDDVNQDTEDVSQVDVMQPGTTIYHPSFGQGTIKERRGDMADIAFESGMKKTFALSIAPLSVVE